MSEIKITINCCDGEPKPGKPCLGELCPRYSRAVREVNRTWPYVGTGYGNLYGNPDKIHYLSKVREVINNERNIKKDS